MYRLRAEYLTKVKKKKKSDTHYLKKNDGYMTPFSMLVLKRNHEILQAMARPCKFHIPVE